MTPRLRFLLSKALPGQAFWDIGCDHGLLAESALWSGQFSEVHFVDPLNHQIQAARERIALHPRLAKRPAFFHAVSGQQISQRLTGSAVIAGMGGQTMLSILDHLQSAQLLGLHRLILSAHKSPQILRQVLQAKPGFALVEELTFIERGRPRPVDVWDLNPDLLKVQSGSECL